jgi:hypothetical protein
MADRRRLAELSEADLERALRDLGRHLEFPATPDLGGRVRARIAAQPAPARRAHLALRWSRPLAALLVGLIVFFGLLGAALLVSPATRQALADRLGLRGVSLSHVTEVPTLEPTATPLPPGTRPPSPGASLGLGQPVSAAEAGQQLGTAILVPDLGTPDAIYLLPETNAVSVVYTARAGLPAVPQAGGLGLLLTEFRASIDRDLLFGKGLPPGTNLEQVQVGAAPGYWIAGAPHLFVRTPNGGVRDLPARLAGNTLLWEQNGLTLRLESALDRDAAIALARTVH